MMRKIDLAISALLLAGLAFSVHAASSTIDEAGQQFGLPSITADIGDTVTFHNGDAVPHYLRVLADDDSAEDLGVQPPGQSLVYKLDKLGQFRVRCGAHPTMKLLITVVKPAPPPKPGHEGAAKPHE